MRKFIVIIVGLLFAAVGIYILKSGEDKVKRCTVEAVGTVVEIQEETTTDSDGTSITYHPVLSYKVEGKTIKSKSPVGTSNKKYNVNENVDILYNPNKPEEFIIKGDKSLNIMGIIFVILGTLCAVAGIVKRPEAFQ